MNFLIKILGLNNIIEDQRNTINRLQNECSEKSNALFNAYRLIEQLKVQIANNKTLHVEFDCINSCGQFKVIDYSNRTDYEKEVQEYLNNGYKLLACNCGFMNSEKYDFDSVYQAILIKENINE